jgi:arylsulfatase A-like enzyme
LRHDQGHVIDFMPTLLELAGTDPAKRDGATGAPPLPGRSLVPAFARNGAVPRDYLFFHHSGNRALRAGDWKIVSAGDNDGRWELYNLAEDRAESNNLAAEQPERLHKMVARWQALQDEFTRQAGEGMEPRKKKARR